MKTFLTTRLFVPVLLIFLSVSAAFAQSGIETAATALDQAVAAQAKNDKQATATALQTGTSAMETEAKKSTGSFKDKLLAQAGNLKKLIPLAQSGLLKGDVLSKAASLGKLALGGSGIESLLGGSLLGKASALTSNLNLVKTGLSALGGSSQSTGNSLISSALAGVNKLNSPLGAAAEPAVKKQLGGVLDLVKGVI